MLRKTKADIGKSPHQLFVLVCVSEIVAAVYQIIIVTLPHMSIRARIVVAVALHKVNHAPDTKPGSKCYNKGLQNVYCAIEKCHKYILSAASAAVRQADKRRSAYAAAQKTALW